MTNNRLIKRTNHCNLLLKVISTLIGTYLPANLSHDMLNYIQRTSLHFNTTKLLLVISCMLCFVEQVQLPSRVCIDVAYLHSLLGFGCCARQHTPNIYCQHFWVKKCCCYKPRKIRADQSHYFSGKRFFSLWPRIVCEWANHQKGGVVISIWLGLLNWTMPQLNISNKK